MIDRLVCALPLSRTGKPAPGILGVVAEDRLLEETLGPDGAAAVARAVVARPKLAGAVAPRAALAWARAAWERGYSGPAPGCDILLEVRKGEGWELGDEAAGATPEGLAAHLIGLAGVSYAPIPRGQVVRRLGENLDRLAATMLAKAEPLEKRSKNVREHLRNVSPRKQRSRILDYMRRQGFQPRAGKKDQIGVGKEGRGITYTDEAGASPEHELGHALQTPVGSSFEHLQRRMGVPQTDNIRMPQAEAGEHESAASAMEPMIRRRAGAGLGSDPEAYRGSKPAAKQRAREHLGAVEEGRVKMGTIHPGSMGQTAGLVPGTSPDAKINARTAKAEPLEKRSKNVRQQTRDITPDQARSRRVKYAQSIGLKPVRSHRSDMTFPQAEGNTLPYGSVFPVEHETAHAMTTPPGKTVREHQDYLSAHATPRVPEVADFDNEDADLVEDGPDEEHEATQHQENLANQLENHVDRRAGVAPSKFRSKYRGDLQSPKDQDEMPEGWVDETATSAAHRSPTAGVYGKDMLVPGQETREAAASHARDFDEGAHFDSTGEAHPPEESLHGRVTRGQAGVNALSGNANLVAMMRQGRTTAKAEPLEKRSKNVRRQLASVPLEERHRRLRAWAGKHLGLDVVPTPKSARYSGFGLGAPREVQASGHDAAHEIGHALQTPVGQTLGERQADIGITGDDAKIPPLDREIDEERANVVEPGIARRAGIAPTAPGQHSRRTDPMNPQVRPARAILGEYDQGIRRIAPTGQVVPGTSPDAKINARAATQKAEGARKTSGRELPGQAAPPRPPMPPDAPAPPAGPKTGGAPASRAAPAPVGTPGNQRPPKTKGISLTRSEARAACGACGKSQEQDGTLTGCACWSDTLERAEAVATPLGYVLRFPEDPEGGLVFAQAVCRAATS